MNIPNVNVISANTILYCSRFEATLVFYRDRLGFPVIFLAGWFVEFSLGGLSRLSIADESRASVKSCAGNGITLSLEVQDIDEIQKKLKISGCNPTAIKNHPWGAKVFYLHDPEGHRLEFWMRKRG